MKNTITLENKPALFISPDLSSKQEVIIDYKTRIYIKRGANPEEARKRFMMRFGYETP